MESGNDFYFPIVEWLSSFSNRRSTIAIEGRCASGKTTLAAYLYRRFPLTVFHMDDFFLPFQMRTRERLAQSGGNVDFQRFQNEVLDPVSKGHPVCLRPFDCSTGGFTSPVHIVPENLVLVEGSYAMHPALSGYYSGSIFLTCSSEEQLRRLSAREHPAKLRRFQNEWIPLEERYFSALSIQSRCDLMLDTTPVFDSANKIRVICGGNQ